MQNTSGSKKKFINSILLFSVASTLLLVGVFAAIGRSEGIVSVDVKQSLSGSAQDCDSSDSYGESFTSFNGNCSGVVSPATDTPIIIFDTDLGPDIDDALALAMLHAYEKRGLAKLAAVTVSRNSGASATYADLVNTFYGRPDIPIGTYRGKTGQDGSDRYAKALSNSGKYPFDISPSEVKEGYILLREVLAAAPDKSVVIVQVGFSGNVSRLLDSGPDSISPQTGTDLVKDKVTLLSIMAGNNTDTEAEFNISNDLNSAKNLFAKWPVALLQSDWNVGGYMHFPGSSILSDYNYVANHPIKESYLNQRLGWHQPFGNTFNMKSWDLTSVIAAVERPEDYFEISAPGLVTLNGSGVSRFQEKTDGLHRTILHAREHSSQQQQAIIDRMVELSRERP